MLTQLGPLIYLKRNLKYTIINDTNFSTGVAKLFADNLKMEFGGLISTSNTYDDQCTEVTIKVDDKVVWTMGIEPLLEIHDKS